MTNDGTNGIAKSQGDGVKKDQEGEGVKNSNGGAAENHDGKKILIGVLASHDGFEQHQSLQKLFEDEDNRDKFGKGNYHFLITGGTYDRLIKGVPIKDSRTNEEKALTLDGDVKNWLLSHSTRLPSANEGGVIILSYLITQRQCCVVWPFFSPDSQHWQRLENLAFMRLCDKCHVKRLLNERSVSTWLKYEAGEYDSNLKLRVNPAQISFPHFKKSDYENLNKKNGKLVDLIRSIDALLSLSIVGDPNEKMGIEKLSKMLKDFQKSQDDPVKFPLNYERLDDFRDLFYAANDGKKKVEDMTIALIAHNEMKPRMIDFVVDYETELKKFKKILATGTTGREVAAATSKELDNKLFRCHSGPEGGDIEIAAAVLYGLCDVVIFFIDPLEAHPHIEDIRVVFQACMMNENVIIITNEMHAREFMARVVRNHDELEWKKVIV